MGCCNRSPQFHSEKPIRGGSVLTQHTTADLPVQDMVRRDLLPRFYFYAYLLQPESVHSLSPSPEDRTQQSGNQDRDLRSCVAQSEKIKSHMTCRFPGYSEQQHLYENAILSHLSILVFEQDAGPSSEFSVSVGHQAQRVTRKFERG